MTRFLEDSGIAEDDDYPFGFIDSINQYYKPSELPIETDSNPNSPFINKSPRGCSELLLELCNDTKSEIIPYFINIMDGRTMRNDTVLLVEHIEDDFDTVRATFGPSAETIILYQTGHSGIEEDQDKAAEDKDNVFRGQN
ncbi:hypothetical protein AUEXF2481DRAFT_33998 [Aureobasidium subglaciale EXF-2481]|uniref:Uncharacterized protein n=1 Tax=Aureobasidium subglaciale (strain EXF-2481) TaxID=1043005 RepID=A0A074Y831_AURSE|nr:uncharacterized protein AUEXF2481DRAFT_33998 [Aureobasidium subglaciale EXF-2481]KEQ90377.1 hypothetical protein AUEXF2481DRAFT_33998 [Aureobasidium subglaciale EXF-2481]